MSRTPSLPAFSRALRTLVQAYARTQYTRLTMTHEAQESSRLYYTKLSDGTMEHSDILKADGTVAEALTWKSDRI